MMGNDKSGRTIRVRDGEAKGRILTILTRHVGIENAIGMGELYERVYCEPWSNRINDTRALRKIITDLRFAGSLIGETRGKNCGGYYLARSAHELKMFFDRRKAEALKKLKMISVMMNVGLPELLGQMSLNLKAQGAGRRAQDNENVQMSLDLRAE